MTSRRIISDGSPFELTYRIIRVWEFPPGVFLDGGLGTLPLASVSAVSDAELPAVVRKIRERIDAEATPGRAGELYTATYVMMGLRYPTELVAKLLAGARHMRESSTFQAIVEEGRVEGRVEGERDVLVSLGTKRFGPPDAATLEAIGGISDPSKLLDLINRIYDSASWQQLLE